MIPLNHYLVLGALLFAIAVAGRGFDARISTEYAVPLTDSACVYCGNCIGVCPTGALFEKIRPKAEMVKNRDFLVYLTTAREKKLWIR